MNVHLSEQPATLNKVFDALSDPTRRAILRQLAKGTATVNEIAQPYDISLPAVSKHLKKLERAGLMVRRKQGRTYYCSLNAAPLKEATTWLAFYQDFWEERLDALVNYIEESTEEEKLNE